jgi:hypothetical protein
MTVGLKNSSNGTNRKELEDRIEYVVVRFSEFDEVCSQKFDWFIKDQQMNEVRQQLGFARYARREQHKITINPKVVWKRFATEEAWQEFQEEGTVNIPGLFDFLLQDEQVSQYIDEEFEMYRHHWYLRGTSGPNLGWMRNMVSLDFGAFAGLCRCCWSRALQLPGRLWNAGAATEGPVERLVAPVGPYTNEL